MTKSRGISVSKDAATRYRKIAEAYHKQRASINITKDIWAHSHMTEVDYTIWCSGCFNNRQNRESAAESVFEDLNSFLEAHNAK